MQELRFAYRNIAWMSAIGGYLLLHYQQWQAAGGYLAGALFAVLVLWSLQQLGESLSVDASTRRWWWKGALWRYLLMLAVLWAVSRQPMVFVAGFAAGVTLLPLSVGVLAVSRGWRKPAWLSVRYFAPRTVRKSRES